MSIDYTKHYDVDSSGDQPVYKSKLKPGYETRHINKMHNHINKQLARKAAKKAAPAAAGEKATGNKGK